MINHYSVLLNHVQSLPIIQHVTFNAYGYETKYQLKKDGNQEYLLDSQNNIFLGYFIKKNDLDYQIKEGNLIPALKIFDEGSGFIPHNLTGPARYSCEELDTDSVISNIAYIIHGLGFQKEEFNTHPEVMAHKNKLKLKKKLESL